MDLACYDDMIAYVQQANAPFVRMEISEATNNHDGQYQHETNTIVINPRVCQKPRFFLKWVVLHELGHSVAVRHGELSEEAADKYSKQWYGDVSELMSYIAEGCAQGSGYYCYIERVMK